MILVIINEDVMPDLERSNTSVKRRPARVTSPRRRQRSNDGTFVESSEEATLSQDLYSTGYYTSFDSAYSSPIASSGGSDNEFLTPE